MPVEVSHIILRHKFSFMGKYTVQFGPFTDVARKRHFLIDHCGLWRGGEPQTMFYTSVF